MPAKIAEATDNPKQCYRISTPLNPGYTGKVFGVMINNGSGRLDPSELDSKLGYTVADILLALRDMDGYEVQPIN